MSMGCTNFNVSSIAASVFSDSYRTPEFSGVSELRTSQIGEDEHERDAIKQYQRLCEANEGEDFTFRQQDARGLHFNIRQYAFLIPLLPNVFHSTKRYFLTLNSGVSGYWKGRIVLMCLLLFTAEERGRAEVEESRCEGVTRPHFISGHTK